MIEEYYSKWLFTRQPYVFVHIIRAQTLIREPLKQASRTAQNYYNIHSVFDTFRVFVLS